MAYFESIIRKLMHPFLRRSLQCIFTLSVLASATSCVRVQRSCDPELKNPKKETEISVYTTQPIFRSYRETVRYEAIGSNITSFDRVLARIKNQAKRDGCEALVNVKFYKQPIGTGRFNSSFPKIEATGVIFED